MRADSPSPEPSEGAGIVIPQNKDIGLGGYGLPYGMPAPMPAYMMVMKPRSEGISYMAHRAMKEAERLGYIVIDARTYDKYKEI